MYTGDSHYTRGLPFPKMAAYIEHVYRKCISHHFDIKLTTEFFTVKP